MMFAQQKCYLFKDIYPRCTTKMTYLIYKVAVASLNCHCNKVRLTQVGSKLLIKILAMSRLTILEVLYGSML